MVETTGNRMMTMRTTDKPFNITKKQVYEAYKAVKSNQGAAGVDKVTIEQFEANLKGNLYKLWNRMSSGSYFPPPVRAVSIPKKSGGERMFGVPTVADRVAQMVVKQLIEPDLDRKREPTAALVMLTQIMCVGVLKHVRKDANGQGRRDHLAGRTAQALDRRAEGQRPDRSA